MGQFKNKLAVIIGATSVGGMGEAVARDLATRGARVIVAGRRKEPAAALAKQIGGQARVCDLGDEASIESLMRTAAERGGGAIDIVINAGGQSFAAMLADVDAATLAQSAQVNLIGPVLAMKHASRHLRSGGVFLQFTSISAQQPTLATTPYSIFKSAVEQAIRIAALEFGAKGIRYLGIAPGIVFTPMTEFINNDFTRQVIERVTPLGRMATVDDVVAAARFLVSDGCFETGHIFPVTGGARITRSLLPQEFFPDH
jgi:NAD(P)-dependent dehydrogenase (short-subunit alcohol dehydrogenase family)